MDLATALATVLTVIKTLAEVEPILVQGVNDLKPFAVALYEKLTGQTISDADLTALEAQVDALSAELQAPMPPVE